MRFTTALIFTTSLISFAHAQEEDAPSFTSTTYGREFATGLVRTHQSEDFLRTAPRVSFVELASSVPARSSLRGKTGAVEDQGTCGSCWDFALTTTLRGTLMSKGRDPGRLSYNYLLNCASTQGACEGGDFSAADYFIKPAGAPAYGSDGVYTGKASACNRKPVVASTRSYRLLGTNLGNNPKGSPPSFKDIAYVVGVLRQPVSVDVEADTRWQSYRSGVYNNCSNLSDNDLNHMVVVEGYDCESSVDSSGKCVFDSQGNLPAGVGTYTIRNSWGANWGDRGYITTKATNKNGKRCNAVATDALYYNIN